MRNTLAIVALFMLFTFSASAQNNKTYKETLAEMFDVSGSEATFNAAIKQMIAIQKQQNPSVNTQLWDNLEAEVLKTSINDLVDMLVPVYEKHMTQEDLEGLITFYKSKVGKKFAEKTPLITAESMQVGQQWGIKIGKVLVEKMKAELAK